MLLAVLALADNGQLVENKIVYGPELLELFKRFFTIVRGATDQCTPWNPFFDRYPVNEGHALVIPAQPVASLFDLDAATQVEIWDTVRQVREILTARYHPAGFNIGINDGRAAGQTIVHAHVHIIPRHAGDVDDPRGGIRWVIPGKAKYWN